MRGFAADTAEPLVGELQAVRAFQLGDDGLLFPLVPGPGPWRSGVNTASCTAEEAHQAPDPHCTCGFYAYFSPGWVYGGSVAAVVSLWGQTIVGSRGVRAQHARIEAVCAPSDVPDEVVERMRAAYPHAAIYRELRLMIDAHPLTPRRGLRRPAPPSDAVVRRARIGLALTLLLAVILAAAVPALHPEAWGVWLRSLAAAVALAPLAVRPGPVPRWREVWLFGRPAWLALFAVSFLIGGDAPTRAVACGVAGVIVVLVVLKDRGRDRRPTPVKPNAAVRELLRERRGTRWDVTDDTTRHGVRQIDSRRPEGGGTVRYLSHMTFVRMAPGQRVNTATRVLTAAAEFGPRGPSMAFVEPMPSGGWVEVVLKPVTVGLDASLPVADVVATLGLPPSAMGRTAFAPHEVPPPLEPGPSAW